VKYAKVHGCAVPRVVAARLRTDGNWQINLQCETKHIVIAQVSPEGTIIWYTGIR